MKDRQRRMLKILKAKDGTSKPGNLAHWWRWKATIMGCSSSEYGPGTYVKLCSSDPLDHGYAYKKLKDPTGTDLRCVTCARLAEAAKG